MGKLTTHVLDTMNGCPASGMQVSLYSLELAGNARAGLSGSGTSPTLIASIKLDEDGRAPGPLLEGATFVPGLYRLVFEVADYFRSAGVSLPEPAFLDQVPIDFGLADIDAHYHVPLLASPWAYSTYRGS